MKFLSSSNAAFLSVAALGSATTALAAADHFILTRLSSLAFARVDPIVNAGEVSGHVHNIMGASCFNQNINTPEEQQACDCSSAIVGDDRSNYWAPALYYQNQNDTFSPILNGNRIYYFTKGDDVKPFPPGLRMISGMAMLRNDSDIRTMGIKISCNHGEQTKFLPNGTTHPGGCKTIAMGIFFPSCGLASGALDSDDHFSHMAWPTGQLGGGGLPFDDPNGYTCPESHPIKYPTIFMEASYYLSSEQPWHSGNPLILSNGDQSGLTYHADFLDGWNQQTMKDTLAQCGEGKGVGEDLGKCAPLAKSASESATWSCRYQGKIPNEDVGFYRPLTALPGCNKVWAADGPDAKPECKEETKPEFIYPNTQFVNLWQRERVPMVFPLAENTTDLTYMRQFIPALGETGASSIKQWGWDASNKASLKLSTITEIAEAAGDPLQGFVNSIIKPSSSSSASASSFASAAASKISSAASAASATASASKSSTTSAPAESAPVSAIAGANVHLVDPEPVSTTSSMASVAMPSAAIESVALIMSSIAPAASSVVPEMSLDDPVASSVAPAASPISSAHHESSTAAAKACHKKHRHGHQQPARDLSAELQEHLQRRSRRALSHH